MCNVTPDLSGLIPASLFLQLRSQATASSKAAQRCSEREESLNLVFVVRYRQSVSSWLFMICSGMGFQERLRLLGVHEGTVNRSHDS